MATDIVRNRRKAACVLAAAAVLMTGPAAAPAADVFVHQGPNGLKYTVTGDGLSKIELNGKTLATGGWYAWNAGPVWFGMGGKDVLAYLDSFGSSFNDVKIMRYLREKAGPDVLTFVEHQCDAILPYSGAYTETDFWAAGSAEGVKETGWYPRSGLWFLQFGRWLLGEDSIPVISRQYDVHGKIPDGFESTTEFFYRNRITPMIEDYMLQGMAEQVRKVQDKYLSEDGRHWR